MTEASLWNQLLIWPILNLLIAFYRLFAILGFSGAFGLAIIALTLLMRLLITPLTNIQMKSAKKMQRLKPKLDELNKKYKDDKAKLQKAQLSLYQEAGVNPAAGCLPLLIQMPVFIGLYRVFILVLDGGTDGDFVSNINKVLYHPALHIEKINTLFLGVNLGIKPSEWQTYGIWLLLIPVITAALQYLQAKLMSPPSPKAQPEEEDQATSMQRQMAMIMPIMIGVFAFSFPVGLALYWNVTTLFGIIQQLRINKKLNK